jgi:DNA-binding response OmpR family regulator
MMCEKKKILIVDDEPYLTSIVSLKLTQAGYDVTVADDGEQALDLAQKLLPDLIVTDFQMPMLSGLDMALQLFAIPATSQIPLIMLTARGHELPSGQAIKTNIRRLMAKPFSARELVEAVRDVLALGDSPKAMSA